MGKRNKPRIFISHIHEDTAIACTLQKYLDDLFLSMFNIFVSSDGASIRAGDNWSGTIETALRESELVLVILSEESLERRWIYFEAGGAYFMGIRVIPVCCRGVKIKQIGTPLNWLYALEGNSLSSVDKLIKDIANFFDIKEPRSDTKILTRILAGEPEVLILPKAEKPFRKHTLPVFFLLDTSGSMAGNRIEFLREGLTKFIDYLQSSADTSCILSVLRFGSGAEILIPPTPIEQLDSIPPISAGGVSDLGAALRVLAEILNDPTIMPTRTLKPIIVVALDGTPSDDWVSGLDKLNETRIGRNAIKICLALGQDADYDVLRRIGNQGILPMVKPEDILGITNFFRWVSSTSSNMTRSEGEEQISLPPLPSLVEDVW